MTFSALITKLTRYAKQKIEWLGLDRAEIEVPVMWVAFARFVCIGLQRRDGTCVIKLPHDFEPRHLVGHEWLKTQGSIPQNPFRNLFMSQSPKLHIFTTTITAPALGTSDDCRFLHCNITEIAIG